MLKKNLSLILAALLLILIIVLVIASNSSSPISEDGVLPEENGEESSTENGEENLTKIEKQEYVLEYLSENISDLSPEKEVLGGTFYITSIDFIDDNKLIIDYEDGHIALTAEVEYEYLDSNNIVINNFNIISE